MHDVRGLPVRNDTRLCSALPGALRRFRTLPLPCVILNEQQALLIFYAPVHVFLCVWALPLTRALKARATHKRNLL